MGEIEYIEEPVSIEIKRGAALVTLPNGKRFALPLDVFRTSVSRAEKALAIYDGNKPVVVPIRPRGKKA